MKVKIELLHTKECPYWKEALKTLVEVINTYKIDAELRVITIGGLRKAEKYRFPGSPTVRINGVDIDPKTIRSVGLGCRIYFHEGKPYGYPPRGMIIAALKNVKAIP